MRKALLIITALLLIFPAQGFSQKKRKARNPLLSQVSQGGHCAEFIWALGMNLLKS